LLRLMLCRLFNRRFRRGLVALNFHGLKDLGFELFHYCLPCCFLRAHLQTLFELCLSWRPLQGIR
jgi:hypothetical protein